MALIELAGPTTCLIIKTVHEPAETTHNMPCRRAQTTNTQIVIMSKCVLPTAGPLFTLTDDLESKTRPKCPLVTKDSLTYPVTMACYF